MSTNDPLGPNDNDASVLRDAILKKVKDLSVSGSFDSVRQARELADLVRKYAENPPSPTNPGTAPHDPFKS